MNTPAKPTLEESARRNPGVAPDRVRKMQDVVKQLQDRGVLKPSKYEIQPGLTASRSGLAAFHRVQSVICIRDNRQCLSDESVREPAT